MPRGKVLALSLLAVLSLAVSVPVIAAKPAVIQGKVLSVVDGDTAHIQLQGRVERVRFIGVDAPELSHPSLGIQEEPYGVQAKDYATKKLQGRTVWLELDVVQRDKYGRLLAYIWLSVPTSTSELSVRAKMFNAQLLLDGYASVLTIPPNVKYSQLFVKFQQEARSKGRGLWGLESTAPRAPPSAAPAAPPSAGGSAPYIGNRNTGKFHYASCYWVTRMNPANKVPFKTRDEAIRAGYVPCKVCKP